LAILGRDAERERLERFVGGPSPAMFLGEEETCLCRFEAPDREAVAELNRQADFRFDRIVEAVDVLPTHGTAGA
jgi:hypothetical protein